MPPRASKGNSVGEGQGSSGFLECSLSESSSVGRARPCQGRGRGFESRLPLVYARVVESVDTPDLKSCALLGVRVQVPPRVQNPDVKVRVFCFLKPCEWASTFHEKVKSQMTSVVWGFSFRHEIYYSNVV